MAQLLDNCTYNKIKLLHELSCMVWFIEKHAKKDATLVGEKENIKMYEKIEKDLEKHIDQLKSSICAPKE